VDAAVVTAGRTARFSGADLAVVTIEQTAWFLGAAVMVMAVEAIGESAAWSQERR
jgi:hypothetical protein